MLKKYELPPGYLYRVPNPSEIIPGSDPREVVVYRDSVTAGLRFPLHPLFVSFFNEFHVTTGQLTPNSWRISTYFLYLCLTNNIDSCLRLFRSIFDMYHVLWSNCYAYIQLKKRRTDKGKATAETTVVPHSTSRVTRGSGTRAYKEFGIHPVDSTVEAEIMLGCVNENLIEKFKNKEAAAM
ncbi:putative Transposase (putative) [Abeliophyllum distichum]|uniref:Transposase (Putative) n=1 Tax=Abeliophyllum distichum TaxID=126358 RepID=A0ABD1SDJ6_9LAMI